MKLCSCGDLVLLTSVSLRRTKPPALWMIYIHGKWQPEQEKWGCDSVSDGEQSIRVQLSSHSRSQPSFPQHSAGEQSSRITVVYPGAKQQHAGKNAVEILQGPPWNMQKIEKGSSGIAHRASDAKILVPNFRKRCAKRVRLWIFPLVCDITTLISLIRANKMCPQNWRQAFWWQKLPRSRCWQTFCADSRDICSLLTPLAYVLIHRWWRMFDSKVATKCPAFPLAAF